MKVAFPRVLLVVVLFAPAASAQEKLVLKEETPYFPLKEGNTWTYKVVGGKEVKDKDGKPVPVVITMSNLERAGDDVCARLDTHRGKELLATELYTIRKDGVYRVEFGGAKIVPPVCILRLPYKKDENWKFDSKIGDKEVKGLYTVAPGEKYKLADKMLETIGVISKDLKVEGQDMVTNQLFAEKVGLVKSTVDIGGVKVALELEKFEEGKK